MTQPKILLISHIYPPATDGGSRIIAKIGDYFDRHQYPTLALASNCFSTDDFVLPNTPTLPPSPKIIRLPVYRHLHRLLKLMGIKGPIFKMFPLIISLIKIVKFRPDYIIAGPLPTSIVIYAYFIKLFASSKLIIIPCFHPLDPDFTKPPLLFVLRHASLICSLTNYENQLLQQYSPSIFTMSAGVDPDFLINPTNIKFPPHPHLLFLGNFSAHKGINLLLKSFTDLKIKFPDLHLTIAGQKTLFHQRFVNTSQDITIIDSGYDTTTLKHLIDNCTVLVLPSRHESFGLVLIEAMARGKPVVVSNLPSTTEIINLTHGGETFNLDNPNDLTSVLENLCSNPFLLMTLGLQGLTYVKQHFTWDRIGDSLCQKLLSL